VISILIIASKEMPLHARSLKKKKKQLVVVMEENWRPRVSLIRELSVTWDIGET
jgi:hypothetical protein